MLMSSYFENKANITAIEFVPMTAGGLVIEVYIKLETLNDLIRFHFLKLV